MTTSQFILHCSSTLNLQTSYKDGWANRARPSRKDLAGTPNLVWRAWAMGRDDAYAYTCDRRSGRVVLGDYKQF